MQNDDSLKSVVLKKYTHIVPYLRKLKNENK